MSKINLQVALTTAFIGNNCGFAVLVDLSKVVLMPLGGFIYKSDNCFLASGGLHVDASLVVAVVNGLGETTWQLDSFWLKFA